MAQKTLTAVERLAAGVLEQELAKIDRDRAHYQRLLDDVPARIAAAQAAHLSKFEANLRTAGALAADEFVEACTCEGSSVAAVEVVTQAERDARAKADADAKAAEAAAAKAATDATLARMKKAGQ